MAALLRHGAARRLGGSVLQRTKAALTSPAVAEERRQLVPRRMLSGQKNPDDVLSSTQKTKEALSTKKHPDEVVREIQQAKEALYDALAKTDVSCKTLANMRLHQHLAAEITARPHDPVWKIYYSGRATYRLLKKAGLLTLLFTGPALCEYFGGYLDDKKVTPAMMMEQKHETISRPI